MNRRLFLRTAAVVAATPVLARELRALTVAPTPISIYKSPNCGCCAKWVTYLKGEGFAPKVLDQDDDAMDRTKDTMGVPVVLRSCHTAVMGSYIVEGHVPAEDLRRLLESKPAILGVSAAGMPASAPGMAQPGAKVVPYEVTAWAKGGKTSVFAKHA